LTFDARPGTPDGRAFRFNGLDRGRRIEQALFVVTLEAYISAGD